MKETITSTHFTVDSESCIGCGRCVDACPMKILEVKEGICTMTQSFLCLECGTCMRECPEHAIHIEGLDATGTTKE